MVSLPLARVGTLRAVCQWVLGVTQCALCLRALWAETLSVVHLLPARGGTLCVVGGVRRGRLGLSMVHCLCRRSMPPLSALTRLLGPQLPKQLECLVCLLLVLGGRWLCHLLVLRGALWVVWPLLVLGGLLCGVYLLLKLRGRLCVGCLFLLRGWTLWVFCLLCVLGVTLGVGCPLLVWAGKLEKRLCVLGLYLHQVMPLR